MSGLRDLLGRLSNGASRERDAIHAINQRIFETSIDLILVVDRRGNFIRVSPSSQAILGYAPEELIGRSAQDLVHPDDLDKTREEMRHARRGRSVRNFDCRYLHRDGRVVPLAWTGVWSEPEEQHFFIGRDMSERNAADEKLRRSQRLESVGQLTGGIAHDFNNLLAVVVGNLDLLQERLAGDPESMQLVEAALTASLRGADLTRQLLAFARRQPLHAKPVDINARVTATLDLLRRTLGEEIEIGTDLVPELWPALVDVSQFESALVNLAINARDAMRGSERRRLSIATENQRLDEAYARQNPDAVPGDYVMIAVSDTGTGMSPEVLARVFEPFFTTKAPGEGTGLGLSMVYGFARQSHGHIRIYSEVGLGTTVRLYLPRADTAGAGLAETAVARALPAARPGERVLVVEDNPEVRKVVTMQLGELGYDVIPAGNADEALGLVARAERIDALFSDVVMPGGINGHELARRVRTARPDIKVLLTSGFARGQVPEAEMGAAFLSKPYRKADLAEKLRTVLDAAPGSVLAQSATPPLR